jgi:uncharacterized phage protein (TIGR01671 family)
MQFTGIKDKNGVEIYEADIVRFDTEDGIATSQVVFDDGDEDESTWISGLRFKVIDLADYEDDEPIGLVIIGNIYQNPELLGQSPDPAIAG